MFVRDIRYRSMSSRPFIQGIGNRKGERREIQINDATPPCIFQPRGRGGRQNSRFSECQWIGRWTRTYDTNDSNSRPLTPVEEIAGRSEVRRVERETAREGSSKGGRVINLFAITRTSRPRVAGRRSSRAIYHAPDERAQRRPVAVTLPRRAI